MRILRLTSLALAVLVAPSAQALEVEELKPTVIAKIDISTQRMRVFVNGEQRYSWRVSTGTRRYRTPTGSYWPYRMHKRWYSTQYNGAPMPHAIFFRAGYAVHGTGAIGRLGRPASHGCVRLHPTHAGLLFKLVEEHGRGRTRIALSGQWRWAPKKSYRKRYRKRRWTGRKKRRVMYRSPRRYR